MTKIVSIEGNIGSGKSTFVKALYEYYQKTDEYNEKKSIFFKNLLIFGKLLKMRNKKILLSVFIEIKKNMHFHFK